MFWNPKYLQYCKPLIRVSKKLNWRFGRPFKCSEYNFEMIRELILPGMVILTRKEYEIANLFIPGYWTHSALAVSQDKIVEATFEGVKIQELHDFFFSQDDFVVLKPRFCDLDGMEMACRHATDALGRPYSFDFSMRENRIYCTALVYTSYMKSCGWHDIHKSTLPKGFKELTEGKIVSPDDIYFSNEHWEVVYSMN